MKCQTTKMKSIAGSIMLIIGILVGVSARFLSHNTAFPLDYLYGISCGLVTASIVVMLIYFIRSKNPKSQKKDMINEQDERHQLIAMRSATVSYSYLFYATTILFLVDLFIPLSFHYTALVLILSTVAIQFISAHYYSKKF